MIFSIAQKMGTNNHKAELSNQNIFIHTVMYYTHEIADDMLIYHPIAGDSGMCLV